MKSSFTQLADKIQQQLFPETKVNLLTIKTSQQLNNQRTNQIVNH